MSMRGSTFPEGYNLFGDKYTVTMEGIIHRFPPLILGQAIKILFSQGGCHIVQLHVGGVET